MLLKKSEHVQPINRKPSFPIIKVNKTKRSSCTKVAPQSWGGQTCESYQIFHAIFQYSMRNKTLQLNSQLVSPAQIKEKIEILVL